VPYTTEMKCASDAERKNPFTRIHILLLKIKIRLHYSLKLPNSHYTGEVIEGGLDNNCPLCHPSCSYMTIKKEVTSTPLVKGLNRLVDGISFSTSDSI
jgi:hypothetical protein